MLIVSRKSFLGFYIMVLFLPFICIAFAIMFLVHFIVLIQMGHADYSWLIPIVIFSSLAVYLIYTGLKNAPKITLDDQFISFNNNTYSLSEIKRISMNGERPFKGLSNTPRQAASITFNDGKEKYIFDEMYSNISEIKSFLQQVVIEGKEYIPPIEQEIEGSAVSCDTYDTFKGNLFASFSGIFLWGMIGFCLYLILIHKDDYNTLFTIGFVQVTNLWFIAVIIITWFLLFSRWVFYFQVSANFLIIKNPNYFWCKKVYRISNIQEVIFDQRGKQPNALSIITKDFHYKRCLAGTLRNATCLALKDKLESYGVSVRNECIF